MKHGRQLLCAALFISASFSLEAATQPVVPTLAQKLTASVTSINDFSTWLLIAAGCVGLVVARKRI